MSIEKKSCPKCGAPMESDQTVCPRCKAEVGSGSSRIEELPHIRPEEKPRPVETAYVPEENDYESAAAGRKPRSKNTWQLVTVLAIIAVIIVIAVVLVIKMNQPAPAQESDNYDAVHVINSNGEEVTATEPPVASDATDAPAATDAPDDAAQATDAPETTDAPAQTDAPAETPAAEEAIAVTAADDTVYVTGSGVNLRTGPSTTYEVVASLSSGTELTRTGTVNGWSRVNYNGEECYISNSLISTTNPNGAEENYTVTESTSTLIVTSDANLRTGPGTNYSVSTTVDAGTKLDCTGASGSWKRVSYNGAELYIANSLVAEGSSDSGKTLTITSKANVRSGAGTGYSVLGVAAVGDTFTIITHTSTNWYEIIYNGSVGYIAGNLISVN